MPKVEDILKLVDAGFNKEEINKLLGESLAAETVVTPAEETPAPEQPAENVQTAPSEENSEVMNRLALEVAELRKQIQKKNLSETFTETPKQDRSQQILASLINPKEDKK